jgi:hypothetical protein
MLQREVHGQYHEVRRNHRYDHQSVARTGMAAPFALGCQLFCLMSLVMKVATGFEREGPFHR